MGDPRSVLSVGETKASSSRDHYHELDALRGIAILGVILSHLTGYWMRYVKVPLDLPLIGLDATDFVYFGARGVSLFFLLSGYLLTWTEEKRTRAGKYSVRSYAARRALRLVPAYWFSIAIVVLVWPTTPSVADVLTQASFLYSWSPYSLARQEGLTVMDHAVWSLTVEAAFYCLLPLIILKLPRPSQRLLLFGGLVVLSLATRIYWAQNAGVQPQGSPEGFTLVGYLYFLPITHLWLFVAGILLRMLVERLSERPARLWLSLFASSLFVVSATLVVAFPLVGLTLHDTRQGPFLMVVDLLVVALFASVVLGTPLLRGLLRWRPLGFVGQISYSMFLLHGTVLVVLHSYVVGDGEALRAWASGLSFLGTWTTYLAYASGVLLFTGALSYVGYRFVESPFLRDKPR